MKISQVLSVIVIFSFFLMGAEVQARSSQAMVHITAMSAPKFELKEGGSVGNIFYNVCNNRAKSFNNIEIKRVQGVSFEPEKFDLQPRQCRMLKIMINPALISREGVHGGPVLQLAQGNKEALEAGFWNVQPEEEQAMSVSVSSSAPDQIILMNLYVGSSSERALDNPAQSKYPGYVFVNTIFNLEEMHVLLSEDYAVRETESNCLNSLSAGHSCLLVIDWTQANGGRTYSSGTVKVDAESHNTNRALGLAALITFDAPSIISTSSDLSNLNLVAGTPLEITVEGSPDHPLFVPGLPNGSLIGQETSCTGSPDNVCTIRLSTDSTNELPLGDFYIQVFQGKGSNALKGKISLNQP
ncbi:MAG: hypothetical protein K0U37_06875 [Gammaproteobacteria bacterium]|nr:hypothetical protein [Gammaproteobacteria bacterium]